ncbi:MAG TPA: helicase-associated domain-containing protein [Ktedonobacterales bacterium]
MSEMGEPQQPQQPHQLQGDAGATAPGLAEAVRLQRDLYLYWSGVRRADGAGLTSRGYVARPALRRLRDDLEAGEPATSGGARGRESADPDAAEVDLPRLLFLRRALERLGLLLMGAGGDSSRLEAAEPRAMARYLARPLAERSRMLARLWLGGAWWPDHLDPRAALPGLLTPAAPRVAITRRRLTEDIASLAPGEIVPAPQTWRPMRAAASHGRAARRRSSIRPPARSAAAGDDVAPAALAGPLSWLGAVVWDEALGEWLVGLPGDALRERRTGGEPAVELLEGHGRVVAQSDLSVMAYPPFSAPELLTLDLSASRESLSQTARYRLTRAAFSGARDFGWDAMEVARRLERLTGVPLPDSLRVTLGDWERMASRLRLEPGVTLLEVASPSTLDALLADRASAAWSMRRLTPTAATLAPEAAPRARAWLLRHGCLPAMRRDEDDLTP